MGKISLKEISYKLALEANIKLRSDCVHLIEKAYKREKKIFPKQALGIILDNSKVAVRKNIPICQDTGLPLVFVEVPREINWKSEYSDSIREGISLAYKQGGLRASAVYPFGSKTSFNPDIIHLEFSHKKTLSITVFPKGFGSENKSKLRMFNPTVSKDEISDFIMAAVKDAGPSACPPFFVGIGIGGTSDYALLLAKKALLERVDKPNPDKSLHLWEKKLIERINSAGIGPMGFGGSYTALSVKIKMHPTHIAGLPVGINISCHALRSASFKISTDNVRII